MGRKALTANQTRALHKVAHHKQVLSVRFFPETQELQVGWRANNGGLIYKWVGSNGRFVSK